MSDVTFTPVNKIARPFTLDDPRIQPEPNTGCWLWARRTDAQGYARTVHPVTGKNVRVHRAVWEALVAPIPTGMVIDHKCRVRSCVNPDHLRVVTHRINCIENSTGFAAVNAAKRLCTKCGGLLANLAGMNQRGCVSCVRIYRRDLARRLRAMAKTSLEA